MIDVLELRERAREWSLREDVVEKDYVLGWLLWGIASEPALADTWVFKGGTCLKKCYFETYRFSEDLDFTVLEGSPVEPEALRTIFAAVGERLYEASGIEIPREQIRFEAYRTPRGGRSIEGRIYYRGPRRPGGDLPRVKIDITLDEVVVYDPVRRPVTHPYTDHFPTGALPSCYSFPEVFGEKLRALAERCLPRDLYDVVSILRRPEARGSAEVVLEVLKEKCRYKEIAVPTFASIEASPRRAELESEWRNMLGHQLPELPPIALYLDGLRELFDWLEGRPAAPPVLRRAPVGANEIMWTPPASSCSSQCGATRGRTARIASIASRAPESPTRRSRQCIRWNSGQPPRSAPRLSCVASPRRPRVRPPPVDAGLGRAPAPAGRGTSCSAPTAASASFVGTRTLQSTK